MRNPKLAILVGLAFVLTAACMTGSAPAEAQGALARDGQRAGADQPAEASSQSRRRRVPTRLRVYRQHLPPTAVRTCDAWYEQEFRPSGTVIVPRMRCRWVAG